MRWKLFADLAEIAGERETDVDVEVEEATTAGDALAALVEHYPDLEDRVLDADGDLCDHVNLLRNGTDVATDSGLETEVEPGDELALFPPVSGG